ncbi:MAG: sulfatase, partial [Deltaproteobacteria bacterium]|nr:sulfatase [Deltaproteobacteria bacterium]
LGLALAACDRPGPHEGYGVLDRSVYDDPARDVLPVADVVKRSATPPARPPNVVVILADDLGYGDLGAYGNRIIRTPNLDALAKQGARFTDFYAADSSCSASRAGLLTGRYPIRSGINHPIHPTTWWSRLSNPFLEWMSRLGVLDGVEIGLEPTVDHLPASEVTIPEALKLAGYATGMAGKWHLGNFRENPAYHPLRHGFDFFVGFPHSNGEHPYSYWEGETMVEGNLGLRQADVTATLTREAIGFVDAHRDAPFFLYVAHKNVHLPLVPSPQFAGRSVAGPYGDSVEELDWSVGEIVRALDERGLREDTLVLFTSDNGAWFSGSNAPLRGHKGEPFEGGQRVPAIVRWPGHVPAGTTIGAPASALDLFPTVLARAGLGLPNDRTIDGRDIGALLDGRSDESAHDALFFFNANVIDGARGGRFKLYRWVNQYMWPLPLDKVSTVGGRGWEEKRYVDPRTGIADHPRMPLLFDLAADPGEAYNVVESHPDEAARLRGAIEAWERDFFANPRGWK